MTTLTISGSLFDKLREHLQGHVEQAAFLLVDCAEDGAMDVHDLRLMRPGDFDVQTGFHISLSDEARAALIRWAWESGKCLVEAHSHGDAGQARFSTSDLHGFREWVPHLWWRLRARPYGALVTAGGTFDGLVWCETPHAPRQLDQILVGDGRVLAATGLTLAANHEEMKL